MGSVCATDRFSGSLPFHRVVESPAPGLFSGESDGARGFALARRRSCRARDSASASSSASPLPLLPPRRGVSSVSSRLVAWTGPTRALLTRRFAARLAAWAVRGWGSAQVRCSACAVSGLSVTR